jgi:hypothetical protein
VSLVENTSTTRLDCTRLVSKGDDKLGHVSRQLYARLEALAASSWRKKLSHCACQLSSKLEHMHRDPHHRAGNLRSSFRLGEDCVQTVLATFTDKSCHILYRRVRRVSTRKLISAYQSFTTRDGTCILQIVCNIVHPGLAVRSILLATDNHPSWHVD